MRATFSLWQQLFHVFVAIEFLLAISCIFVSHRLMNPDIHISVPLFWICVGFASLFSIKTILHNERSLDEHKPASTLFYHQILNIVIPIALLLVCLAFSTNPLVVLYPDGFDGSFICGVFIGVRGVLTSATAMIYSQLNKYSQLMEKEERRGEEVNKCYSDF